jgi:hypothetical protein
MWNNRNGRDGLLTLKLRSATKGCTAEVLERVVGDTHPHDLGTRE